MRVGSTGETQTIESEEHQEDKKQTKIEYRVIEEAYMQLPPYLMIFFADRYWRDFIDNA